MHASPLPLPLPSVTYPLLAALVRTFPDTPASLHHLLRQRQQALGLAVRAERKASSEPVPGRRAVAAAPPAGGGAEETISPTQTLFCGCFAAAASATADPRSRILTPRRQGPWVRRAPRGEHRRSPALWCPAHQHLLAPSFLPQPFKEGTMIWKRSAVLRFYSVCGLLLQGNPRPAAGSIICPSCFPGHCHPMVSCSLSLSYLLIPHRELVAAPGSHLCHWGTKGDSRAPSGTVSPQNNATIPLHFAAALLCWHRSSGAEFQTGSRAQALSAFSFLNQPGVSDFVPHLSLGQELAQR